MEDTLAEQIATQLRRDILNGKLAPGASVKERDNAQELGVSRTPMREAIRILANEGLLVLRPSRSPIVAEPSFKQVSDDIEVISALELLSAELACEHASDAQIEEIATLQDEMVRFTNAGDTVRAFEVDMNFHIAIARASGNRSLAEMHRAILARLWRARFLSARRKRSRVKVLRQHNAIVSSLRARDRLALRAELQAHLEGLLTNVRDYFDNEERNRGGAAGVTEEVH